MLNYFYGQLRNTSQTVPTIISFRFSALSNRLAYFGTIKTNIEMKMILGVLFTIVLCSYPTQADDIYQLTAAAYEEDKESTMVNISKRSSKRDRIFFRNPESTFLSSCKRCGLINERELEPALVHGDDVGPPNKYPWMVALQMEGWTFCGGAIISENFILTAAHCITHYTEKYQVFKPPRGGKMKYLDPEELQVAFLTSTYELTPGQPIEEIIPHPGFCMGHMRHDIALLKLENKIECNRFNNPICLPPRNFDTPEGTVFIVSGWGDEAPPKSVPTEKLKEGKIKQVNFDTCEKLFTRNLKDHYCVVGVNEQSPCYGDSGGPMFYRHLGKYYAVGVASISTSNLCKADMPSTYTSVSKNMDWITQVTGLSSA